MGYRPRNRVATFDAPTGGIVDLVMMQKQARVDIDDPEFPLLAEAEAAAVAHVEKELQKLLTPRQIVLRLPDLPSNRNPVELPGGPVTALTSIVVDGVTVTGTAFGHSPALLVPDADWPAVTGEGYPVVITYTAGLSTVPDDVKAAVRLLATHLFDNRNAAGAPMAEIPLGVNALLGPQRIRPA